MSTFFDSLYWGARRLLARFLWLLVLPLLLVVDALGVPVYLVNGLSTANEFSLFVSGHTYYYALPPTSTLLLELPPGNIAFDTVVGGYGWTNYDLVDGFATVISVGVGGGSYPDAHSFEMPVPPSGFTFDFDVALYAFLAGFFTVFPYGVWRAIKGIVREAE